MGSKLILLNPGQPNGKPKLPFYVFDGADKPHLAFPVFVQFIIIVVILIHIDKTRNGTGQHVFEIDLVRRR